MHVSQLDSKIPHTQRDLHILYIYSDGPAMSDKQMSQFGWCKVVFHVFCFIFTNGQCVTMRTSTSSGLLHVNWSVCVLLE